MKRDNIFLAAPLAAAWLLGSSGATLSQSDDFYAGRTIEMIVAVPAGGGYDGYARLMARHLGRHIPGEPTFVVKNMPGAGGARAANHLYNVAAKDGSVIGTITRELPLLPLLDPKNTGPRFDARAFNWLGSPQQETGLFLVAKKAGVAELDDLKSKELAVSSTGPGSAPSVFPRVLDDIFGWKFKIIEGYPGSQEALQALETGEVDGHVSGGSSAAFRARIKPWLESGQVKVMLQMGFRKDDDFPNAPLVLDLAKKDADRSLLELVLTPQLMGRPFLAPPEVPAERVAILRKAFDAALKDERLLAEAGKIGMDIQPVSGEEIERVLKKVYSAPPELVERARKSMRR